MKNSRKDINFLSTSEKCSNSCKKFKKLFQRL